MFNNFFWEFQRTRIFSDHRTKNNKQYFRDEGRDFDDEGFYEMVINPGSFLRKFPDKKALLQTDAL